MSVFALIVRRDLRLALRRPSDMVSVVLFFVLAIVLFPLGVGPEANLLARIAAGTIWVAALLAAMLSLDHLFGQDAEDGTLDLLALTPGPLEVVVLAKCLAHWLTTGLPLIVAAPVLAVLMNTLLLAMALGTPILSLVGAIGAALTVGARRGGVLLSLLVLPLVTPVLIFGVGAVDAALMGLNPRPHLLILAGLLVGSGFLCPLAAAAGLRLTLE